MFGGSQLSGTVAPEESMSYGHRHTQTQRERERDRGGREST